MKKFIVTLLLLVIVSAAPSKQMISKSADNKAAFNQLPFSLPEDTDVLFTYVKTCS